MSPRKYNNYPVVMRKGGKGGGKDRGRTADDMLIHFIVSFCNGCGTNLAICQLGPFSFNQLGPSRLPTFCIIIIS